MNITITEKNTFSREFFIDIPWPEIDQDFNKFTVDFSKKIKIPGFRPGKVPKKILMDRFQPSIEAEFVENTVNRYYSKALEEKEIAPVNQGSVSDIDFKFESHFKFKVAFEVEPEITIPRLKKNTFKIEKSEYVMDEIDVEMAIEDVRMRNADIQNVESGSKVDDFIICDLQEIDNSGIAIIGEKLETKYIKIGQSPFDGDNQEKLLNLKPQQKVNIKIPKDWSLIKDIKYYDEVVQDYYKDITSPKIVRELQANNGDQLCFCLLYTSPSPRALSTSRMPSSA